MLIECILRRPGGTKIDLGDVEYHFAPDADGHHVAEVEDDDHIDRLLAIPEGYRVARKRPAALSSPAAFEALTFDRDAFLGVNVDQTSIDASEASSTDREQVPAAVATAPTEANGDSLDREALVDAYLKHFGKKPHHNLGAEKIAAELKAAGAL